MTPGPTGGMLRHMRRLAVAADRGEVSDAELLGDFTARQDEAAFAALVRRHGPMVLAVCRRVLHHEADAEDAFQATFLILVRKAAGIARPAALGCWLYEVALRTARRARARAAVRRAHERRVPQMPPQDFVAAVAWRDLRPVLDEEVGRLPAGYRESFVLCCLQGRTCAQAAAQLGCPRGTVWRRLAAARTLLRRRLTRRGLDLPAGVLAAALAHGRASAIVPARLAAATTGAAVGAAGADISAPVSALVLDGLRATAPSQAKAALGIVLALGLTCAGAALLAPETRTPQAAPADSGPTRGAGRDAKAPAVPGGEVTVAGRVLDTDGRPVAGAEILYLPPRQRHPFLEGDPREFGQDSHGAAITGADGSFKLTVGPGSGHLRVMGRDRAYVQYARTRREAFGDDAEERSLLAHAFVRLNVRPAADPDAVTATLRPAVRIRGQLLDQDGKPVEEAFLTLGHLAPEADRQSRVPHVRVKGGRFEAGEVEAGAHYAVLLVGADFRRAGVGQLTASAGDVGALRVRLHDTGCVRARCVDGQGKPVGARYPVRVWIKGLDNEGPSAGRMERLPNPFVDEVATDRAGRIGLDGLIPGVTYALSAGGREVREFVAEPGKKSELGDVVVPAR